MTDNAKELTGRLTRQLLRLLRVRYRTSIPYNPRCNARTERVNRFIMGTLRACVHADPKSVHEIRSFVDIVPFVYNRMYIPGTQVSPFMITTVDSH